MYFEVVLFLFYVSAVFCKTQNQFPHQIESISQGQNCSCRCIVQTERGKPCAGSSSKHEIAYSVQTLVIGKDCKCTCLAPPPPENCANKKSTMQSSRENVNESVGDLLHNDEAITEVNISELHDNLKQTIDSFKEALSNTTNNKNVYSYLELFRKHIDDMPNLLDASKNNYTDEKIKSMPELNSVIQNVYLNRTSLEINSTSKNTTIGVEKSVIPTKEIVRSLETHLKENITSPGKIKDGIFFQDDDKESLKNGTKDSIIIKGESSEKIIVPAIHDLKTNSTSKNLDNRGDIVNIASTSTPQLTTAGLNMIKHINDTKNTSLNSTNFALNTKSRTLQKSLLKHILNKTATTQISLSNYSSTSGSNSTNNISQTTYFNIVTTPETYKKGNTNGSDVQSIPTKVTTYYSKNISLFTTTAPTEVLISTTADSNTITTDAVLLEPTTSNVSSYRSADYDEKDYQDEFDIGEPVETPKTQTIIFTTNSTQTLKSIVVATEQRSTQVDDFDTTTIASDIKSGSGDKKNKNLYYTEDDDVDVEEYYQNYDDDFATTTTEQTTTTTTEKTTTPAAKGCGTLFNISRPHVVHDFGRRVGSWMLDAAYSSYENSKIYVTNFYYGNNLIQFKNLEQFKKFRWSNSYMLPYNWIGTGHVVYNGSFYYNRAFSKNIIKYNLRHRFVSAWGHLRHAMYDPTTPFTWKGHSRVHMAVDESGLWVMYPAYSDYDVSTTSQTFIINQLDADDLHTTRTWRTTIHKKSLSHVFIVCGVVYFTDRYDSYRARMTHAFDTYTGVKRDLYLPFLNRYAYNVQMLFLPKDGKIYSWDKGHQVIYNVNLSY